MGGKEAVSSLQGSLPPGPQQLLSSSTSLSADLFIKDTTAIPGDSSPGPWRKSSSITCVCRPSGAVTGAVTIGAAEARPPTRCHSLLLLFSVFVFLIFKLHVVDLPCSVRFRYPAK